MSAAPINLLDLDQKTMVDFFADLSEKPFRARQLLKWLHQVGVTDFAKMTDLSHKLRSRLADNCIIQAPQIVDEKISAYGTIKWLLETGDSNRIETVFIPTDKRGTLCISSQIGCALACTFCATAKQGFNRNLTTAQIIGQLFVAKQQLGDDKKISNVVLMGMGEPLLNFANVVRAMNLMLDDYAYGLSKRRVTVSTSGVVPAMDKLSAACDVSLAVSLHAARDELRDELVPINQKYPLRQLLAACKSYAKTGPRKYITFEYVMLDGVNDSAKDATDLLKLLAKVPAKINLIPFNPFSGVAYKCSPPDAIAKFRDILHQGGMVVTIRKTRGDGIAAACGQLVGKVQDKSRRHLKLAQANYA